MTRSAVVQYSETSSQSGSSPPVLPTDCQQCAACCFSRLETYVRVTGDDYERLGQSADEIVHFIGNRAYLRMVGGKCIALAVDGESRARCTVYERRPGVCRDLERGSRECEGEIVTKWERSPGCIGAGRRLEP